MPELCSTTPETGFTQRTYNLHIRQHPIAARACGPWDRNRRPVDPPPIAQILVSDFDPTSSVHQDVLQDPQFTVGCSLYHFNRQSELEVATCIDDTGLKLRLSGKTFVSPFYVDKDPDPNSAPANGFSHNPTSYDDSSFGPLNLCDAKKLPQPATFFIFPDLSISSPGLYRLKFRLTNWGSAKDTGQLTSILAEAWSDPFQVYSAKEFPGMRTSSALANGLKELGFAGLRSRGNGEEEKRKTV